MADGKLHWAIAALVGTLVAAPIASAQTPGPIESSYTPVDLYTTKKACRKISKSTEDEEFGERWRCPGVAGVDLFVHYEDARDYLSYGRRGKPETSTFGLEPIGGVRETIEWRGRKDAKGKIAPFATVSRMGFENPKVDKAEWWSLLVVTRLTAPLKGSCVVGYVDGRANPDANEIARRVADSWASDVKRPCPASSDVVPFVGKVEGKWKDKTPVAAP